MKRLSKVKYDSEMNVMDVPQIKSKSKPQIIPYELFKRMVVDRDRIFYNEAKQTGDIATMEFLKNRHK